MARLVCYSCGRRYYSAADLERLKGDLDCDECGAPLFEALDLGPPPPPQLELRPDAGSDLAA